jgi:hypothetical protein
MAVPFARLRSTNARTDGRLDLDKVSAIVFIVDRGSVKPERRCDLAGRPRCLLNARATLRAALFRLGLIGLARRGL